MNTRISWGLFESMMMTSSLSDESFGFWFWIGEINHIKNWKMKMKIIWFACGVSTWPYYNSSDDRMSALCALRIGWMLSVLSDSSLNEFEREEIAATRSGNRDNWLMMSDVAMFDRQWVRAQCNNNSFRGSLSAKSMAVPLMWCP